jgi:hypothetical protein
MSNMKINIVFFLILPLIIFLYHLMQSGVIISCKSTGKDKFKIVFFDQEVSEFSWYEETETTRHFKHEEWCNRYNFWGAQETVTM